MSAHEFPRGIKRQELIRGPLLMRRRTPAPRRRLGCCPLAHAARSEPMLHPGGGDRPHEGRAQAQRELHTDIILRLVELEARRQEVEGGIRLRPKMTPAQIAEAERMACEWKSLSAP
jgi:hypothetical protein